MITYASINGRQTGPFVFDKSQKRLVLDGLEGTEERRHVELASELGNYQAENIVAGSLMIKVAENGIRFEIFGESGRFRAADPGQLWTERALVRQHIICLMAGTGRKLGLVEMSNDSFVFELVES